MVYDENIPRHLLGECSRVFAGSFKENLCLVLVSLAGINPFIEQLRICVMPLLHGMRGGLLCSADCGVEFGGEWVTSV